MRLASFEWQTKQHQKDKPLEAGGQIVLDFGNYHLSVIDDGYGRDKGLYEIGVFRAKDGIAFDMVNLPGVTNEGDTVKGNLTAEEVDVIIRKMETITHTHPTQV
jgi:hypothetical protein